MKVLLPFACGLLSLFSVNLLPAIEGQDKSSLQRPIQSPKNEDKVEINARQQQALLMLESAVEKARHLENSTIKVKILTQAADILWDYNESDARKLFVDILDIIDSLKQNVIVNQSIQPKASTQISAHLEDLRSDLFQRIARHDFKLAEKLRNAIKESESNRAIQGEKEDLAWDIAIAVAKTHPEQTARFVQASLRGGINPILGDALVGIRRANPQLADQLFTDAVVIARSNLEVADAVENLAEYVFPTEAETLQERQPSFDPSHAAAIRSFLAYVADKVRSKGTLDVDVSSIETQHEYRTLQSLLPLFENLLPDQAVLVRGRIATLSAALSGQRTEAASLSRQEQLEQLLHQAEAAIGDRKRDLGFIKASQAAVTLGDFERAISICERITDPNERMIQTSLLTYQVARAKLQHGEIEEAIRLAEKIQFLPQRVAIFILTATSLHTNKQDLRARAVLEDIWDWTNKAANTPQKARALLTLTVKMADYDGDRSFAFIQSAVRTIDRTDFSTPDTNGKPSRVAQITFDMLDFSTSFSQLARLDFDRAFQAALSFNNREASLWSEVIVCQQVLSSHPGFNSRSPK